MLPRYALRRFAGATLIVALLSTQFGCVVDRLRQPIADFAAATSVVTAQARLSYGEINRVERMRAVRTAVRLKKPIRDSDLKAKTTFLTGEDLATRLDALDHLDQYAKLLSQIVGSDAPDKIATSAANLETALNGLADRINKLANGPAGGSAGDGADKKPDNSKFKSVFGVFAEVTRTVLAALAKRKQEDALKAAIAKGDAPVNDLIEAIKDDLRLVYENKRSNIETDLADAFVAYNREAVSANPDKDKLEELGKVLNDNLDAQEAFNAADPADALDKMKQAHSQMVEFARGGGGGNIADTVAAIQTFVDSATRLGAAVIKLKSTTGENS